MLFVAASTVCAVAPNLAVLIAARVLPGLVGAPLVPLALSVLLGKQAAGGRIHCLRPWCCSPRPASVPPSAAS